MPKFITAGDKKNTNGIPPTAVGTDVLPAGCMHRTERIILSSAPKDLTARSTSRRGHLPSSGKKENNCQDRESGTRFPIFLPLLLCC